MTTLAAQITPTGIVLPSYADILAQLQLFYFATYGSDVQITPDTQDGQFLGILANLINDNNQMAAAVYNAYSPATAQGAGLASLVKINGLKPKSPSPSTVSVTITGVAGTVLTGALIGDNQNLGTQWALPSPTFIGGGGTVTVTATCTANGAIAAGAGTLTQIVTPTLGWATVTNPAAATVGAPVESDAALRIRQANSTSGNSQTPLAAIKAAILAVPGVTSAVVYENDTGSADSVGRPPHSITAVVTGGTAAAVANAIQSKKSPGTTTFGTTSFTVLDPAGVPNLINFYLTTPINLLVNVTIKALTGYTSSTAVLIQEALAAFVNSIPVGTNSYLTRLYAAANLSGDVVAAALGISQAQLDALAATFIVTSLTQSISPAGPTAADITIAYFQEATLLASNVSITTTA